jgi:methylmalonyl-CoA/ethylmalonyl-CoA epimerase
MPIASDIDHVGIAVRDLDTAVLHYGRTLGVEPGHREILELQGVEAVFLDVGHSAIELMAPLRPDSPVGRFLDRRGEGFHHVAYRVDDLPATLAHLDAEGVRLVDRMPREGSRGTRIAFAHPSSFGGVLVELVELPT